MHITGIMLIFVLVIAIAVACLRIMTRENPSTDLLARLSDKLASPVWFQLFLAAIVVVGSMIFLEYPLLVLGLLVLVAAVSCLCLWCREFLLLMSLRDDEFPGRFDKPIWAFVLVALGPLGYWLFRRHLALHWPSSDIDDPESLHSKPRPVPDLP